MHGIPLTGKAYGLNACQVHAIFSWARCLFALTARVAAAQFTDLQQKEQLAKLAMARSELAAAPSTRKFKFVSGVNSQVGPGHAAPCVCVCLLHTLLRQAGPG